MAKVLKAIVVTALVLAVAGASPAVAQDDVERENLADLREVNVVVEELAADAQSAGLDRRSIENVIEGLLEQRGVPLGNSRSAADLYVNIDTFRGSTGLYACRFNRSMQQCQRVYPPGFDSRVSCVAAC